MELLALLAWCAGGIPALGSAVAEAGELASNIVSPDVLGLEAQLGMDWRNLVLSIALGLALAALLLPVMFEDVKAEVTVHMKSERRSLQRLRLPKASVVRSMSRPDPADEASSRLGQFRKSVRKSIMAVASKDGEGEDNRALSRVRRRVTTMMVPLRMLRGGSRWENFELQPPDSSTAAKRRPLLAFVNSKSGGGQGIQVLKELRNLLHNMQVVDLQEESPEAALRWWSRTPEDGRGATRYRVLVCGGDGTVGWVLGVLEQLALEYVPPVAILPLGTGNDLARVCGWGGGFTGGRVAEVLQKVDGAHVALLDRWAVVCRDALPAERPASLPAMVATERERKSLVMCNYFGIGVDAAVALDFHQMRERSPHLFFSRLVNKIWYAKSGAVNFLQRACAKLGSKITLECDGVKVDVPPHLEGIVVLNIKSFGGGSDLWGSAGSAQGAASADEDDERDSSSEDRSDDDDDEPGELSDSDAVLRKARQSMQDKRLDVVGVHGSFQLGAAQVGLYSAVRLAQASRVRITNREAVPVEVDGEPWLFAKNGEIEIGFKSQAFMLARHAPGGHAVATDVVDWALQQEVITVEQRNKLMTEIASRAQTASSMASTADLASLG